MGRGSADPFPGRPNEQGRSLPGHPVTSGEPELAHASTVNIHGTPVRNLRDCANKPIDHPESENQQPIAHSQYGFHIRNGSALPAHSFGEGFMTLTWSLGTALGMLGVAFTFASFAMKTMLPLRVL